jgi:phosphate transport system protein
VVLLTEPNPEIVEFSKSLQEMHKIASSSLIEVMTAFEDLDLELAEGIEDKLESLEQLIFQMEENMIEKLADKLKSTEDLKLLTTYLQASNHLLRVGEYASKIGRIVLLCDGMDHFKELESIPYLAELAKNTLDISINTLLNGDFSEIDELEKLEAEADRETSQMFEEITEYLRSDRNIGLMAMYYVLVGRYCERAADEALAIAQKAFYLHTGVRKRLGLEYRYGDSEAPH